MFGMVLVFARSVASGRDNETHAGSNMMKSNFPNQSVLVHLGKRDAPEPWRNLTGTLLKDRFKVLPAQPY